MGLSAVGLGPVFWLLVSDIFLKAARGRGMGFATVADRSSDLLVGSTCLDGVGRPAACFLDAAQTAVGSASTLRLVPETEGRGISAPR